MGELCNGIANRIVKIAGGDIASVNVRDAAPGGHAGERSCHGLDTIADDQHNVGAQPPKRFRNSNHAAPQAPRLIQRVAIAALHPRAGCDRPSAGFDIANRPSEFRKQMNAGSDDVQMQGRMRSDGAQRGFH